MNGVTCICYKRGLPRMPWVLRSPRRVAAMHRQQELIRAKHEYEEALRRSSSVAPKI